MNILLIGGSGNLMNQLIIKLKKEGHRVHLLTGEQHAANTYEKVFERYEFTYDNGNLSEIFQSVSPDVTLFLGAYDTNFSWRHSERESVRFIAGLMNILVAYSMINKGSLYSFLPKSFIEILNRIYGRKNRRAPAGSVGPHWNRRRIFAAISGRTGI